VVGALREQPLLTLGRLSAQTGFEVERLAACLPGLAADGLVEAGPAALAGRSSGRVRLAG
jgi:hypothetical protein